MKFRAYDEDNKKMIYSYDIFHDEEIAEIYVQVFDENGDLKIVNVDEDYKELPVMSFTGYRDKNGKEIYEGDIVEFSDLREEGYEYREAYDIGNRAEVEFYMGRYELANFVEDDTGVINGMNSNWCNEDWYDFMGKELTIVGNIFENRDLLPITENNGY